MPTRRELIKLGLLTGAGLWAGYGSSTLAQSSPYPSKRPAPGDRRFTSETVEETIRAMKQQITDPELAWMFENCYPNTLDTTVHPGEMGGKPDTFVITGDIDAMWLRDSSAQVWPYLPLAHRDPKLRNLLAGVIHRQAHCILLDPYANAFLEDPAAKSQWASDYTVMKPGIHERKWELDSLCYPIRLAHGYWKQTGDTSPFDAHWEQAMRLVIETFRQQQRKDGPGPYSFQRGGDPPAPDSQSVYGPPVKPTGLICSRFRPSDDPTTYQFLIPSNFFAVVSLHQLAEMLSKVRHNAPAAAQADALAGEVAGALRQHALVAQAAGGMIFAYEIDGLGSTLLMDDVGVPSLLSLPYLGACAADDAVYQATRRFSWSSANPWFVEGKYTGGGSPHAGRDMIWPMGTLMYGLTSRSESEVTACLQTLKATQAGTGFIHESFYKDDPTRFTRSWFAWANTLFGEFILQTAQRFPHALNADFVKTS